MKKIFNFLFIASCVFVLASCSEDDEPTLAELKLDKTSIEVVEEATVTITIQTGNGGYTATPASTSVATASVSGTTITVTGVTEGSTTIAIVDEKGKTASVTVSVVSKYTVPTSAQFVWDGAKTDFETTNNWGLAIYTNRLAITNLIDKKQYILSWTGDLSKGDKTGGKLQVVGSGDPITLTIFRVVKSESNTYYIAFQNNSKTGNIYFSK